MKTLITLSFLSLILVNCSCKQTDRIVDKESPELKVILGCSAGILSKYGGAVELKAKLENKAKDKEASLNLGASLNDEVHGYIMGIMPKKDALEAYKIYDNCYDREMTRPIKNTAYPALIESQISAATNLEKRWSEANSNKISIQIEKHNDYALLAKELDLIRDSELNHKNKIIKNDRTALLYFIASEIINKQEYRQDRETLKENAENYAELSRKAAEKSRKYYEEIINNTLDSNIRSWLSREEIDMVTLDRLSESYAQNVFLNKQQYKIKLTDTLKRIPCSYKNKYNFDKNIVYTRISLKKDILTCT